MSAPNAPRSGVPPLIITQDNKFWFDAVREGRLEIQRCTACGTLRHPPAPACAECRSFDWDSIPASGRCTLHSYTVLYHPKDPAFHYPLAVGLADLEEGTRLVADIADVDPEDLSIGMELEIGFAAHAHGEILPQLRRRRGGAQ